MTNTPPWFDFDLEDIASSIRSSLGRDKTKEFLLNIKTLKADIKKNPELGPTWHEMDLQWADVRWRESAVFGGQRFKAIYYAPAQGPIEMLRLLRPGESALAKIRVALGAQHPPPT